MIIKQALAEASNQLAARGIENPRLEAETLLAAVLEKPRTHLFAWPEVLLSEMQGQRWQQYLARRLAGEPLAYILGYREFWSLEFAVGPEVLIPRPETELLVELALQRIPPDASLRILDLGTGSGAIAAAVASERPMARLLATDASKAALMMAQRNFQRLGLEKRIATRLGSWCETLQPDETFDLILSNPPYIAADDPHLGRGDLPAEPAMALSSGQSGLEAISILCNCAPRHLRPGGWLLLEHGYTQGAEVRRLLGQSGFIQVESWQDLAAHERVSGGQKR